MIPRCKAKDFDHFIDLCKSKNLISPTKDMSNASPNEVIQANIDTTLLILKEYNTWSHSI